MKPPSLSLTSPPHLPPLPSNAQHPPFPTTSFLPRFLSLSFPTSPQPFSRSPNPNIPPTPGSPRGWMASSVSEIPCFLAPCEPDDGVRGGGRTTIIGSPRRPFPVDDHHWGSRTTLPRGRPSLGVPDDPTPWMTIPGGAGLLTGCQVRTPSWSLSQVNSSSSGFLSFSLLPLFFHHQIRYERQNHSVSPGQFIIKKKRGKLLFFFFLRGGLIHFSGDRVMGRTVSPARGSYRPASHLHRPEQCSE